MPKTLTSTPAVHQRRHPRQWLSNPYDWVDEGDVMEIGFGCWRLDLFAGFVSWIWEEHEEQTVTAVFIIHNLSENLCITRYV
ncbi:hypothetical protein CFP56_016583 [Quercus suber]|uniref:Uncharacterized protein n=1 Tax=Quercus suber TaxID=58331 RepID=A0AAW0KMX5_QUESU